MRGKSGAYRGGLNPMRGGAQQTNQTVIFPNNDESRA